MEKLRPILKQRYWICFGLALILGLFGWWNASGDLAVKTTARETSVKASFDKAAKEKTAPNKDWVAAGKKENEQDLAAYKTASLQLWKRQQGARNWPEQIRSEMSKVAYFGEVESKQTRERWARIYPDQIDDLMSLANAFDHATGKGAVVVDDTRITRQVYDKWRINRPTSNEIWNNQEDIWLLKALLTSIAKANESATRITESQVREIKRLHLRGGNRNTKPPAPAGGGGGGGGLSGNRVRDVDDEDGGGSPFGGAFMGAAPGGTMHPGAPFAVAGGGDILIQEFGGVGGAGGMGFPGSGNRVMDVDDEGTGGRGAPAEVRYVDGSDKDIGYKTRAFLLDVVVRDDRLPDLLAKLTNSDFPVEIVRVEIVPFGGGGASMAGFAGANATNVDDDGGGFRSGGIFGGGGGGNPFGGPIGGGGGNRRRDKKGGGSARNPGIQGGWADDILATAEAAKAAEALNAAMSDPLLIEVHIGGLLTLYMTPEETKTQAKTEESGEKEAAAAAPANTKTEDPTGSGDSKGTTPATDAPATDAPAADAPATDAPAADAPAADAPAADAPATDAPATDAPATDAPTTDAPTTESDSEGSSDDQSPKATDSPGEPAVDVDTSAESPGSGPALPVPNTDPAKAPVKPSP